MEKTPFAKSIDVLPSALPIFPLNGVLLLPFGELPLNIFEPRYKDMIDDVLKGDRLIGMVQVKNSDAKIPDVYKIGCAGKITEFQETPDHRYLINLSGISRFAIDDELSVTTSYRQVSPNWTTYNSDLDLSDCLDLDRERMIGMLQTYFKNHDLSCDWEKIKTATDNHLITCLSMICPFSAQEKQALLEAECCKQRAQTFMAMLEIANHTHEIGDRKH